LFAYLSYRDAPAAIDWLEAIGFELVTRQPRDDGAVLHAELSRGTPSSCSRAPTPTPPSIARRPLDR
jgi:hypothetical protein